MLISPLDFVRAIDESSLTCRELGHTWRRLSTTRQPLGYRRELKCQSCGTRRTELIDKRGMIINRQYHYTEGYLLPGGSRWGLSRSDYRREVLRREGLEVTPAAWEGLEEELMQDVQQ